MIFLSVRQTIKFNEHMSIKIDKNTLQTKHIAVVRDKKRQLCKESLVEKSAQ